MNTRIDLQSVVNEKGTLVIGDVEKHIPFLMKRFFAITAVPSGCQRGGHAHREQNQLLVCLSGRVEVSLDDGTQRWTEVLDDPGVGLHIKPMVWAEQVYESPDTVMLVLCDDVYREDDYLRSYDDFSKAV